MFKWKKDKVSSKMTDTFIGEGTIVEGTIRSAGSLRLEGQLRGDISCEGDVILGESGFAISNITANNVVLAGQVNGNVTITGKLTIMSTGKLYGNMTAASLTIEEGGLLQGSSAMDQAEPDALNPMERRTGTDRRVTNLPYSGEERRSGLDRRDLAAGELPAIPKKISYRAIEKPAAGEADGAEQLESTETAKENNESIVTDPLRESGRAFIHSIAGSAKESGIAESAKEIGGLAESAKEFSGMTESTKEFGGIAESTKEFGENAATSRLASKRLNEGLNAEERAALSGILVAEASAAATSEAIEEVAAAAEIAAAFEESTDASVVDAGIVESAEGDETFEGVERDETVEVAAIQQVNAEANAIEVAEGLNTEAAVSVNAEAVETVVQSNNVYSYGFENRANGSEPASEPEHKERDSIDDRNATDAAALLRNW
ncbi:polymer-forming cytoskeletal protein [Paenibacillus sp. OV219]|uniref:bactofilin family protein n=1 Tax=Paenibacillus sp. OV219 TaxID=1884377 RepID=UPI0008ABA6F2|nr:polymer-forming cytoskeletal protein [Paenibacillus sp. OV219]SEP02325.1 Polymer-forming protein [Paenibacillus sp. OV219]